MADFRVIVEVVRFAGEFFGFGSVEFGVRTSGDDDRFDFFGQFAVGDFAEAFEVVF